MKYRSIINASSCTLRNTSVAQPKFNVFQQITIIIALLKRVQAEETITFPKFYMMHVINLSCLRSNSFSVVITCKIHCLIIFLPLEDSCTRLSKQAMSRMQSKRYYIFQFFTSVLFDIRALVTFMNAHDALRYLTTKDFYRI